MLKHAYSVGLFLALREAGLEKTADMTSAMVRAVIGAAIGAPVAGLFAQQVYWPLSHMNPTQSRLRTDFGQGALAGALLGAAGGLAYPQAARLIGKLRGQTHFGGRPLEL